MTSVAAYELLHIFFHTATNSFGILANGLLIYLTLFRAPNLIGRTYSFLILNSGITDLLACSTGLLVQFRIIPTGYSILFLPSGPCKWINAFVYAIISRLSRHTITLHCYTHSAWSLLICFAYRYLLLKNIVIAKRTLLLSLGIIYLPSLLQLITFCCICNDPQELSPVLRGRFPDYDFDPAVLTGIPTVLEWKALYVTLHCTVPVFPIYAVIYCCRRRTLHVLKSQEAVTSRTKRLHRDLNQILTFQAMLPAAFVFAIICFGLGMLRIYNHPVLEYSTFAVLGVMPSIAPVGTLCCVKPYSDWIRSHLPKTLPSHSPQYLVSPQTPRY